MHACQGCLNKPSKIEALARGTKMPSRSKACSELQAEPRVLYNPTALREKF